MKIQQQFLWPLNIHGGVETYMYYTSKALLKMGHEPEILCSNQQDSHIKKEHIEGIRIIKYPDYAIENKLWLLRTTIKIHHIKKWISNFAEDAAQIWTHNFKYAYVSAKSFPNKNTAYIIHSITPRMWLWDQAIGGFKLRTYRNIEKLQMHYYEKKAIELCTRVITVSDMRRLEICDYYKVPKDRIEVVKSGVDMSRYRPREKNYKLMESLDIPINAKVVITVGRLVRIKNLSLLLKSFSKCKVPNTYLVLIGDGPEKQNLVDLAKELRLLEHIRFVGSQSNLIDYYSIADIFVLPSIYEGFSLSLLEAMASGIACIASKSDYPFIIVGNDEVINDGENGFLIRVDKKEELINRMNNLLTDPVLREKIGKAALKTCRDNFSWDKCTTRLLN